MYKIIVVISIILFISACGKDDFSSISESVKEHYKSPSDSLKLKAAIFLLENIRGLNSLDARSMAGNEVFYSYMKESAAEIDELAGGVGKRKIDEIVISRGLDSVANSLNNQLPKVKPIYIPDSITVTKEFLIKNIEEAFWAWENLPWSKKVTFDDFKDYVLPYRVIDTYWPESRSYFIHKYKFLEKAFKYDTDLWVVGDSIRKDIHLWYKEDGVFLSSHSYLNPLSFENILKGGISDCRAATALRVSAMRSMGIPVAYETIPQWGNVNTSHFFYKILSYKPDTIKQLITNDNIYRDTRHIVDGSSYTEKLKDVPPSNIPIIYSKSIPKVFRKCFSIQSTSLAHQIADWRSIPMVFRDDRMLDVTANYLETADVSVKLFRSGGKKVSYLCVFNPSGWQPVDWAFVDNGQSFFKKLGKNIVYLPAYFENDKIVPANSPFILCQDGTIRFLKPSKEKEPLKLVRKFRFSSHNAGQAMEAVGIRFQGANDGDLKDTTTFFKINDIKYNMTEVLITNPKKFRYCMMQFGGKKNTSVAEVEFWGLNSNGKEVLLKGAFIGNKGKEAHKLINAFDNDRATYFSGAESGSQFIGIDLGKNHSARITKIRFCPRNDTNNILPGDLYELFYWQDGWNSLGEQIGVDLVPLSYDAPKNALFWLKNNTRGKEERIFTYVNGQQLFW